VNGEAEDVAIHGGETVELVVLAVEAEGIIDSRRMVKQTPYKALAESTSRWAESTEGIEIFKISHSCASSKITLVKKLDGGLTAFASNPHDG
jgi:hypothetical protein